jgi:valyl-tRNA synthetase
MRPVAVKPQMKVIGPKFKDKSGKIIKALSGMDPKLVADQKARGAISVPVDGETVEVPEQAAEIVVESLSAGEAVDILRLDRATVLVRR